MILRSRPRSKEAKMKFKLEDIVNLRDPLAELSEVQMSAAASFRIAELIDTMQSTLDNIEEQRLKLVKQACEEAGVPDAPNVPTAKMPEFLKMYNALLEDETVEVSVRSIDVNSLTGNIAPKYLMVLRQFGIIVDQQGD